MGAQKYTLGDKVFRESLVAGLKGEETLANSKLMLVGGSVAQYYTSGHSLYRATADIDVAPSTLLSRDDLRAWGDYVSNLVALSGHHPSSKKMHFGQEIKLTDLEKALLVHLNAHSPNFFGRYKTKIEGEFERAHYNHIDNYITRMLSPEDTITNKLRRLTYFENLLTDAERVTYRKIKDGLFDDVEIKDLYEMLCVVNKIRNQNLELLQKLSPMELSNEFCRYKVTKDIYDIFSIINSQRDGRLKLDKKVFLEAAKLALS